MTTQIDDQLDPLQQWVIKHPWTITYIAVVVTLIMFAQLYLIFFTD
jgi:hypothetical protein